VIRLLAVTLRAPVMTALPKPTPLKETSWAETIVKFCRAVSVEKAAGTVTSPVPAVIVTENAPSRSFPKVISPLDELTTKFPVRFMGPVKKIGLPAVERVPPILMLPLPV